MTANPTPPNLRGCHCFISAVFGASVLALSALCVFTDHYLGLIPVAIFTIAVGRYLDGLSEAR